MAEERKLTKKAIIDPIKLLHDRWSIPKKMLVEDEQSSMRIKQKQEQPLQLGKLQTIIDRSIDRINDNEGILELLPDINLIREILVASILNPKDLNEIKLNFKSDEPSIPPEFIETIRTHFTTEYDLESELSDILGEALVDKGASILLPIPASTLYNTMMASGHTVESIYGSVIPNMLFTNIGVVSIGSKEYGGELPALENFTKIAYGPDVARNGSEQGIKFEPMVTITDNPLHLLKAGLHKANSKIHLKKYLRDNIGLESLSLRNDSTTHNKLYYKKIYDFVESITINKQSPEEAGKNMNPIIFKLPVESVIPVYVPGEPSNHVGYYIILDELGNPVKASRNSNFFKELNSKLESTVKNSGNTYIKTTLLGNNDMININLDNEFTQPIIDAYINQLEKELVAAVKNGVHGENVEVSRPEALFRIMFSRQLQKTRTKALYIPVELMTYLAFNYNEIGMGVSLIEKTKLYSSLRAIMMFAEIMAGIKNSVPGRVLNITLDAEDPDPQATVETILNEFTAIQSVGLPLGKLNPSDIVEGIQRANIQVKIDGGEIFPNTAIEIEDKHREMTKPDSDLSEMLKKHHYSGFGVTPQLVDQGLDGEFATAIRASNLLQAKRDMVHQNTFTYWLTDHVHKYIFCGGPLYHSLKELWNDIIEEQKLAAKEMREQKVKAAIEKAQAISETDKLEEDTDKSGTSPDAGEVGLDKGKVDTTNVEAKLDTLKIEASEEEVEEELEPEEEYIPLTFEEVIESIYCELPKPDTAVIINQSTAFKDYSDFIDAVIPVYISEDMVRNMLKGEYTNDVLASTQISIATMLKRQYLRRQNILPEIDEVLVSDDFNAVENIKGHYKVMLQFIGELLPAIYQSEYDNVDKKAIEAITKVTKQKEIDFPEGTGGDSGGGDSGGEDSGEESGGEGSGDEGSDKDMDTGEDLGSSDFGLDDEGDTGAEDKGGEDKAPKEDKEAKEEKPEDTKKEDKKATDTGKDLDMKELGMDKKEEK